MERYRSFRWGPGGKPSPDGPDHSRGPSLGLPQVFDAGKTLGIEVLYGTVPPHLMSRGKLYGRNPHELWPHGQHMMLPWEDGYMWTVLETGHRGLKAGTLIGLYYNPKGRGCAGKWQRDVSTFSRILQELWPLRRGMSGQGTENFGTHQQQGLPAGGAVQGRLHWLQNVCHDLS
jgi:hypothetical protein